MNDLSKQLSCQVKQAILKGFVTTYLYFWHQFYKNESKDVDVIKKIVKDQSFTTYVTIGHKENTISQASKFERKVITLRTEIITKDKGTNPLPSHL